MWTPTTPDAPGQWFRYTAHDFLVATLKNERIHPYIEHRLRVGAIYECACGYQPTSEDDLAQHFATARNGELS